MLPKPQLSSNMKNNDEPTMTTTPATEETTRLIQPSSRRSLLLQEGSSKKWISISIIIVILSSLTPLLFSARPEQQQQQKLNNKNSSAHDVDHSQDVEAPSAAFHGIPTNCNKVFFGHKLELNIACKCNNKTKCLPSIPLFEWPSSEDEYLIFTSNRQGDRFRRQLINLKKNPDHDIEYFKDHFLLEVETNRRAQQVSGFGGAFTDSATEVISSLEEPLRRQLLLDYFGPEGLDYNMGRVPISGTDMSRRVYSYDDLPPGEEDLELKKFKLQEEDLLYKIPLIKRVNLMKTKRKLPELKLIAASWSAPAWMKSNFRLVQGRLRGNSSNGPYYDAYARYIVRFLREYEERGIKMWALTPQNEPHTPMRIAEKIQFNSLNFKPKEMADYLANSLVPELLDANKTRDSIKLFIWDDTLDDMEHYEQAALESPIVRQFMTGTAIHWYSQGLRNKPYGLLYEMRKKVIPPEFSLISTEACFIGKPRPGNWERGMKYARDIIENLRAGSLAWIDWNLALNMSGGPTWVGNILDSAILVDGEQQTYYKNPMYYALGHISRFVKPNSHVIPTVIYERPSQKSSNSSSKNNDDHYWQAAEALNQVTAVTAELRPLSSSANISETILNRKLAMVILNRSQESRRVRLKFGEACSAKMKQPALRLSLEPESITSLAFLC